MNKRELIITTLIAGVVSTCDKFDVYSPSQIHRTVRVLGDGRYVVYYPWRQVEKEFGPDRARAVPLYLRAKGLLPTECGSEAVVVVRGGETQGPDGWAEFHCRE